MLQLHDWVLKWHAVWSSRNQPLIIHWNSYHVIFPWFISAFSWLVCSSVWLSSFCCQRHFRVFLFCPCCCSFICRLLIFTNGPRVTFNIITSGKPGFMLPRNIGSIPIHLGYLFLFQSNPLITAMNHVVYKAQWGLLFLFTAHYLLTDNKAVWIILRTFHQVPDHMVGISLLSS